VTLLAVALGGAIGSSTRYGLGRAIRTDSAFPWSTFLINVSGCFLIGLLTVALVDRHNGPAWLRAGLIVGVLGGYTTFSAFGQETFSLLQSRDAAVALGYAAGSVLLGVLAVYAGTLLGRSF
jgi:CrcB protein